MFFPTVMQFGFIIQGANFLFFFFFLHILKKLEVNHMLPRTLGSDFPGHLQASCGYYSSHNVTIQFGYKVITNMVNSL